jgi:hypothetical protein
MTQRVSESLVAVLIRIGLLLALAILLMAENAQAQHVESLSPSFLAGSNHGQARNPHRLAPSDSCWRTHAGGHMLEALEPTGKRSK